MKDKVLLLAYRLGPRQGDLEWFVRAGVAPPGEPRHCTAVPLPHITGERLGRADVQDLGAIVADDPPVGKSRSSFSEGITTVP